MPTTSHLIERQIPSRDIQTGMFLPSFVGPVEVTRVDSQRGEVTVEMTARTPHAVYSRTFASWDLVTILETAEGAGGTLSAVDVAALVAFGFTGAAVSADCGNWVRGGQWASTEHDVDVEAWAFRSSPGSLLVVHFLGTERTSKRLWRVETSGLSVLHALNALLQHARGQVKVVDLGVQED